MILPGKVAVEVGRPASAAAALWHEHRPGDAAGMVGARVRLAAAHRGQQGACRSLTGTDHKGRVYVFAQLRGGRSVVVRGGVEPPTFRFSGGRSYRLSYLTLAMKPKARTLRS